MKSTQIFNTEEDRLSHLIIGAMIEVHQHLGPGLLESVYEAAAAYEFTARLLTFERQKPVHVTYKGQALDCGFRLDFLVDNLVIVELKAVDAILPIHKAQVINYLKLTGCKLGLLINFNVPILRNGIHRIANQL